MSVPIGEDGTFVLENVPSPSVYDLVVEKPGFATSTQRIDVSAGEERTGVEITLRQGDGVISGIVSSASGPLPEATVVATSGQTSVTTMSLTAEKNQTEGGFTLRGLPTPASFTVVVSLADHASQTLTLTLGAGQRLTGVSIMLDSSSGVLKGQVLTEADEQPAPGVLVSVTDGVQTVQTATSSREEDAGDVAGDRPGAARRVHRDVQPLRPRHADPRAGPRRAGQAGRRRHGHHRHVEGHRGLAALGHRGGGRRGPASSRREVAPSPSARRR